MKLLLEDVVYDVPSNLLMTWVNMTPNFRDEFRGHWESYKKQRIGTQVPTADEYNSLLDGFLRDEIEWYYQLMFEVMMDMRETMKGDFEDYRSDLTADELIEYAKSESVTSHTPNLKQPIRIPVT